MSPVQGIKLWVVCNGIQSVVLQNLPASSFIRQVGFSSTISQCLSVFSKGSKSSVSYICSSARLPIKQKLNIWLFFFVKHSSKHHFKLCKYLVNFFIFFQCQGSNVCFSKYVQYIRNKMIIIIAIWLFYNLFGQVIHK